MYEPIGQDKEGNEIHLLDILEQQQTDIIDKMEFQSLKNKLFQSMQKVLTERERKILVLRYGLCGLKEMTQSEVGEIFGISRSYVSRIEKKALEKLYFELNET